MIADLQDNGKLDRSWSCERLLDALTELSEASQPGSMSMLDELDGRLRAECTAWPVPVDDTAWPVLVDEPELTPGGSEPTANSVEATLSAALTEFQPADTDSGEIYSVPWEIVVAGIVSGGLVALIAAAAVRQWRLLRP